MSYTDDPVMDYINHDKEQTRWLLRRPVCDICKEHIQDDVMYKIDGEIYCEECMRNEFAHDIPEDSWDDYPDYDPPDDDECDYECDYEEDY